MGNEILRRILDERCARIKWVTNVFVTHLLFEFGFAQILFKPITKYYG
jgi:hypothetical protein